MTALNAAAVASLRSGLSAGMNPQTVQYQVLTLGVPGEATNMSALVTVRTRMQAPDASGRLIEVADIINVRPLEAESLVLGDFIIYDGETYVITETSGTDVRRLVCVYKPTKTIQRTPRFRAEGG